MFLFLSLFASFALNALSQSSCLSGAVLSSDGSKCFHFVADTADFNTAQNLCANFGGNLASVVNATDDKIIFDVAQQRFSKGNYWIGSSNVNKNLLWKWMSGGCIRYNNFAKDEPEDDVPLCAMVDSSGSWRSTSCFELLSFVCEVSLRLPRRQTPNLLTSHHRPKQSSCLTCPSEWTSFGKTGSCYRVFHNQNWTGAEHVCQKHGAHLASIHSEDELRFIISLAESGRNTTNMLDSTWIGGYSPQDNHKYQWVDGTEWDFALWAHSQPDFQWERCIHIPTDQTGQTGKWRDRFNNYHCSNELRAFVCKQRVDYPIIVFTQQELYVSFIF